VKKLCILSAVLILLLATVPAAFGQTVTSRVTGTVADETGGVIAGATVELTYLLTQQLTTTTTGANGRFLFNSVIGGDYDLHIEVPGFNGYDQRNLNVATQTTVALGTINMTIGEVTTSIEVQAESLRVETQSSDRTQMMQSTEIESIPLVGRDYRGLIRAMPGVTRTQTADRAGRGGLGDMNGGNTGQFLISIDGITSQDSGATGTAYIAPSIDAIGEVKVVTANFNAEYGSRAGGQMNITMKSGQQNFHGTGFYYWRHEQFNANEWFNNAEGDEKGRYRFSNPGGTIGGPIFWPNKFNTSRTKLFFFYSHEQLFSKQTQPIRRINMPTAAERTGDFSNSLTEDGIPLSTIITDPTTGELFPNGIIPFESQTAMGRAVLGIFPLPQAGVVDPTGDRNYNTQYQFETDRPRGDRILRIDFNIGASTTSYVRLLDTGYKWEGFRNTLGSAGDWDQFKSLRQEPSQGISLVVVHMFSPTVINETTIGMNYTYQHAAASDDEDFAAGNELQSFVDPATGSVVDVPHIFEGANWQNLIPNINFGANGAQISGESLYSQNTLDFGFNNRWPFQGTDTLTSIINNVSWVKGDHNLKFGFYYERMARNVSVYAQYNVSGTYWFGTDEANPLDTGWPLSNALVGSVQSYGEDNKQQLNPARYNQIEWFVQDSWQASSRLSFDLGMRFQILQPIFSKGSTLGMFQQTTYDRSQTGQLLYPGCADGSTTGCDRADRIAVNPNTERSYPFSRVGFFDPLSHLGRSPFSGIVQSDSTAFDTPGPVLLSPRFGFAYDVFGNGKTAVRGGMGIFYTQAYTVDRIGATGAGIGPMAAPPNFEAPRFWNTTFDDVRNAQAFLAAQRVVGGSREFKNPTVYNFSFGIQQELFRGTVLDVAYVGNRSLHVFDEDQIDSNALPPGITWTPEGMEWSAADGPSGSGTVNQELLDPTNNGAFIAENLIRGLVGYHGWDDVRIWTNRGGNSNYNSLQVQLKYRAGNQLSISGNYTWSRLLRYAPSRGTQWVTDDNIYEHVGDNRPHAVNMNWLWQIPGVSSSANPFVKGVLNNWTLSGVGAIFSGEPYGVTCSVQSAPLGYPSGTPTGGIPFRCEQNGETLLPEGTKAPVGSGTTDRMFFPINEEAFVLPKPEALGFGSAPVRSFYQPGFFNVDMSIQKAFPIGESMSLEFRADTINTFNHFNPENPERRLRFRYTTGDQTRSGIGRMNSEQNDARRIVLSARFRF